MKIPKINVHVYLIRFFNNPKTIAGFGVFETWVKFINRALIFCIILCAIIVVIKDYRADYYLIRAFTVPESLDKRGFGGVAFVNAILVELTKVRKNLYNDSNKGNLRSLSNTRFLKDKNVIALEEDIGLKNGTKIGDFDLKSITHFLKRLFNDTNNDKSISGIVTINTENQYVLNMKLSPDDKVISVQDSTADGLVRQAAFELMMGNREDYRLDNAINYYSSQSDFDKAERLAEVTELTYQMNKDPNKVPKTEWIGLYLAQSNLYIAKRDLIKAEAAVDSLCLKFSNDMSGLCQKILISNTKMLNFYYSSPKNTDSIKFYSRKSIDICSRYEKDSAKWQSEYGDKKYAKALMYFFWSQALSIDLPTNERAFVFEKLNQALKFDANLSFANNDLAYYYMIDAKPIDYKKAESYIKKALQAAPNQAAFLDTYAEFYLMQNKMGKCLEYLDKALAHSNIYEHVSVSDYNTDSRWDELCNNPDTSIQNAYLLLLRKWKKQETLN